MMGLLAPLLLGGLAFLGIPWWIHRRRRPPRNPTPFSSLMFVPTTSSPRRARKEIEHPWLMAFRMLLLALLAFTFARPFQQVLATPDLDTPGPAYHVVLVDVSASMGADGPRLARDPALVTALESIGAKDHVAVVAFDQRPHLLQPFGEGTGKSAVRQALETLPDPAGHTDFHSALNAASTLLLGVDSAGDETIRRTIHLVSDFQRSGLPADGPLFQLPESIDLRLYSVAGSPADNAAVEEVVLVPDGATRLLVRARIRNHSEAPTRLQVRTEVDGEMHHEDTVTLSGLGSQALSLPVEVDREQVHQVRVHIVEEDGFPGDNAGYAVYTPEAIRTIGVFQGGEQGNSVESDRFLTSAMADSQPLPWHLMGANVAEIADAAARPWDVLLVIGGTMPPTEAMALREYVQGGGALLLIPPSAGFSEAIVDAMLTPAAIDVLGARYAEVSEAQYATFSWVDFSHPVFQYFREPTYSDFSMLRFNNFFRLAAQRPEEVSVLARFEGEDGATEYPALIAYSAGEGQVVVWAFSLASEWTNLTRTRRFVPMLHESIALLLPTMAPPRHWYVGETATPPDGDFAGSVQLPGSTTPLSLDKATAALDRLSGPGVLQWEDSNAQHIAAESITLDPRESALTAYSEEEFSLRVGAFTRSDPAAEGESPVAPGDIVHWEYGYSLLALLLCGYLGEAWYAYWLGRRGPVES